MNFEGFENFENWVGAPQAGKVLQTRSHSGFDVAVHKVAKDAT